MRHSGYSWAFAGAVIALTLAALASFREISALSVGPQREDTTRRWPEDTIALATQAAPGLASYAALAASDSGWRQQNARPYTLTELRARGDGRRSPRQAMQDRVYALTRRGDQGRAIAELERWVGSHSSDGDALLWLARLLNQSGRSQESIKRYRQALALAGGR